MPSVVDLFSGCGGFSLGAELAGFHSLVAIDIDPTLQSAYRLNFPRTQAVEASVVDLEESSWRLFLGNERPDCVIGGPPCQGFSWIGLRKKDDPRNNLVYHYYRNVEILRPKFFIMENVEGLLDAENIDILMNALEVVSPFYKILDPIIVNAKDFGAATSRKRVVVIGYDPLEVDEITRDCIRSALPLGATVRDAIADLPSPIKETKDPSDFGWGRYNIPTGPLSAYARRLRAAPPENIGWHEGLAHFKNGQVSGLFETKHTPLVSARYAAVPPGKSDAVSKSQRLVWSGHCPTLRAGTGADKGAFQAVRPLHPAEGRVITVREAARLQGFPDWFVFHPTKWHSFRMIGNSVSPAVSYGILTSISQKLKTRLAA